MFRTFVFGLFLGLFGTGALLHLVPVVDQHRVPSHVTVLTNGGNEETFSVRLPGDRIMVGRPGVATPVPAGLAWPDAPALSGFEAELFKVRDRDNTVIGVASRMKQGGGAGFVQWVIHLPARGTMFAALEPNPGAGQARAGTLRAGTGEFELRRGSVREAFVREDGSDDPDSEGRIDLQVALIGLQEESK
ncbi:MAG: hypothetical protein L0Y45_05145 [Woeseiaceae bacterium]|nr:hypothetical protein [Woeseiaceae bacterium]